MAVRVVPLAPADDSRVAAVWDGADESELVAVARVEPAAFLALYNRYFERVLGYARLRLLDRAASEDVTSEVFTSALARIDTFEFRGEGSFAAWLFRIAHNAVNDVHRGRRTARASDETVAALPDLAGGPEERLLELERRQRVGYLLTLLSGEEQRLLALRYGAGLSYEEISALVGGRPGSLRVRVHRILEQLRQRYPDDE